MPVRLTNTTQKPFTITLYHAKYCVSGGPCECRKEVFRRPIQYAGQGRMAASQIKELGWSVEEKYIPVSLTIPPMQSLEGLHEAVLQVPQVITASKQKPALLRIAHTGAKPTAAPTVVPLKAVSHRALSSVKPVKVSVAVPVEATPTSPVVDLPEEDTKKELRSKKSSRKSSSKGRR